MNPISLCMKVIVNKISIICEMDGRMVCHIKCCRREELSGGVILLALGKEGPMCPMLKELRDEALKHLSLALKELEPLLSWRPFGYSGFISLT